MFVKKIVSSLDDFDFQDLSVFKNQINHSEKFNGIQFLMDCDDIICNQIEDPFTISKAVKIKCQIKIIKSNDGKNLEMRFSLLSTVQNLIYFSIIIHSIFVISSLILLITNKLSAESIWFKASFGLPFCNILALIFIKVSFDEQIFQMSKFILTQMEKYLILKKDESENNITEI
jgi:hypothetical protein